ncbi:hypothetical protein FHW67_003015 [Herbaspirillum sp. Sphag1AN]|uniref:hypothetical protein n=1 Tax=unclassified Herbaspirillum TaxID=2624150 RepID=UPI0016193603|nr:MULTISPECIES: hypothetical protein [unclassified Herbaspirillum]MBB3213714.1 hypothetical protein [Herbaspirillum sp. Sphag1AN]MBB3246911.1 hypothetical protein [Herbaspirillum sp. Sphag64]
MRIALAAFIMGNAISSGATGLVTLPDDDNASEEAIANLNHDSPCWFTRQSGLESHYMNLRLCRQAEAARGMSLPHQESSAPLVPGTQPG